MARCLKNNNMQRNGQRHPYMDVMAVKEGESKD